MPEFEKLITSTFVVALFAATLSYANDQTEFFEKNVRPVLVDHCHECHSGQSKKIKGGLRLDSRSLILEGGDSGPAIVPGDARKSLLITAVRHIDDDLKMPPKTKLTALQIQALATWIQNGAIWPNGDPAIDPIAHARKTHWAFKPVTKPALPLVKGKSWIRTPIDQFVLARLEAKGMTPSPRASSRTLIRRAFFDVIGLPPTYEQASSSKPLAGIIDELLASQHYGERWARHWLDVARYADTKGYVGVDRGNRYPYAYTYRDYVVRAFNEDLPFNRFILEQLAADKLKDADKRSLAALGFITVGRRFNNRQQDIIDDRIDVVTRGFMGLTVSCARCHDHKYDPVPTEDYYSLYGVFASCEEPKDLDKPLIVDLDSSPQLKKYKQELDKRQNERARYIEQVRIKAAKELRTRAGDYLVYIARNLPAHRDGPAPLQSKRGPLRRALAVRWFAHIASHKHRDPVFGPWHYFAAMKRDGFADAAKAAIAKIDELEKDPLPGAPRINEKIKQVLRENPPKSMAEFAKLYGDLFESVANQRTKLNDPAMEEIRQVLHGNDSPATLTTADSERLVSRAERGKLRAIEKKIESWQATSPAAPPRAMVLNDRSRPYNPVVFVRGSADRPGKSVPRRFLQVLEHVDGGQPFTNGSGRLKMAQAIASSNNPLTARVIVNRVWMHHFGAGLVRTPSDFGTRGEAPTHPLLLDWLATWFMDNGYSLKKLHRLIMTSSVYQQASNDRADYTATDPENRLLWKMNRRRLEFEPMRDAMLSVAGTLDKRVGGQPVNLNTFQGQFWSTRRGIYLLIDRQDLPNLFRVFDFANPDSTSPRRPQTTVPQQALFMLNSPFVVQQAHAIYLRVMLEKKVDRITTMYRQVYSRDPTADERKQALLFVNGDDDQFEKLAQALIVSNEFMFVD